MPDEWQDEDRLPAEVRPRSWMYVEGQSEQNLNLWENEQKFMIDENN